MLMYAGFNIPWIAKLITLENLPMIGRLGMTLM